MSEKIVTKIFNYGDENESSWPPKYGTGGSGVYHIDKESGELKEGYPEPEFKPYGQAPYVIQDTIDKYYHPAAETWVESRSKLRQFDDMTGTITTDKKLPGNPSRQRDLEKERRKDLHDSMHKAVAQIDAGTAPLTEETRALCDRQNELMSQRLGFDAFNVAGRKKNAKGKKYRRK